MMNKFFSAILLATSFAWLVSAQEATVYTQCTKPKTAAITFDDGPWIYLDEITDTLNAAEAKGTIFINGQNWGCVYNEELRTKLKYAYDHGHQIASHTWAHKNLSTLTQQQVHEEFWGVELAMMRILGAFPAMVRPPFGEVNSIVREVAQARGQAIVNWDFDSGDTWNIPVADQKARYDKIASEKPSAIMALNHETHESSARVLLPHAIEKLKAAGYSLVTAAECLGLPDYQWVGNPEPPSDDWQCNWESA